MASQRQDFLRKINKGWSPVHMNLIRVKKSFVKPREKPQQDTIESETKADSKESTESQNANKAEESPK